MNDANPCAISHVSLSTIMQHSMGNATHLGFMADDEGQVQAFCEAAVAAGAAFCDMDLVKKLYMDK